MITRSLFAAMATVCVCSSAFAIKPFTLVEDGYPERPKQLELEQTFSTEWQLKGNPGFFSFGHELELEYGLKEDFTLRVAGTYAFEHSSEGDSTHFDEGKIEGQYYFSNPNVDDIGLSFIGAATVGENVMGFEGIFVAQKDLASWTLAYNLGFSTSIEGAFDRSTENTVTGAITNSFGAVYDLGGNLKIGGEISAEATYDDWSNFDKLNVYAGPCLNWVPNDRMWITAGVSYNVSGHSDEPRVLGGIIVGFYLN